MWPTQITFICLPFVEGAIITAPNSTTQSHGLCVGRSIECRRQTRRFLPHVWRCLCDLLFRTAATAVERFVSGERIAVLCRRRLWLLWLLVRWPEWTWVFGVSAFSQIYALLFSNSIFFKCWNIQFNYRCSWLGTASKWILLCDWMLPRDVKLVFSWNEQVKIVNGLIETALKKLLLHFFSMKKRKRRLVLFPEFPDTLSAV